MEILNATITDDGHINCPKCGATIITPVGVNPNTGEIEKMILIAGQIGNCMRPSCKIAYTVTKEEALKHNHFWFPDDPEFII